MSASRLASVGGVLAALIFATVPAAAQAVESHWHAGDTQLRGGAHLVVGSKGKLTIHVLTGAQAGTEVKCTVSYKGEIWNPQPKGAGEDLINQITFPKCGAKPAFCAVSKKLPVFGLGLPWHSKLYREPPVEGDELEGVQLEIRCKSGESAVIEGSLAGPVGSAKTTPVGVLTNSLDTDEARVELQLQLKGGRDITIGP